MSDEDDKARRAERSAKRQALIARIQEITDEDHAADRQSLKEMTVEEKQRWFTQSQARIDELMGVQRELDTLHREQERETGSMRAFAAECCANCGRSTALFRRVNLSEGIFWKGRNASAILNASVGTLSDWSGCWTF